MHYLQVFVDYQVFILDVTMSYAWTVKVICSFDDLSEDITRLIFGEMLVRSLFNTFKEIVRRATQKLGRGERLKGR